MDSKSVVACLFALLTIGSAPLCAAQILSVPSETFPTLDAALAKARQGDTVSVGDGVYEGNFFLNPGTALVSHNTRGAVLKGKGRGVVLSMATGSSIEGFVIQDGTIGILSTSAHTSIVRCLITANSQSGIMCIGHMPRVEDNTIVYNRGSGIQGWDVRSTTSGIIHNTIAYNANHGIAVDGTSDIIVEYNILSFNAQFALKVNPETVTTRTRGNSFFRNGVAGETASADNVSCDPAFIDHSRLDFTLAQGSPCHDTGPGRTTPGVRHEAR